MSTSTMPATIPMYVDQTMTFSACRSDATVAHGVPGNSDGVTSRDGDAVTRR